MDKLLGKILSIENRAQNLINEAKEEEKNIQDKLVNEIKQLEEDIIQKQNRKIGQLKERELDEATIESNKNNEVVNEKLKKMENISKNNMECWVDEVVTSIIER